MRTHRQAKSALGLIAAVIALFLMSMPASATVNAPADVTDGDLELLDEAGDPIDTIDLGNPGTSCGTTSSTATANSDGTISASLNSNSATNIAGTNYKVTMTVTLSGTWAGSSVSVTGSAVATLVRTTGANCTPITGAGNCTVTAGNLSLSGTTTASLPTLATGDTATLSGGNSPGDNLVSGTATNCGVMISANNGWANVNGVVVTIL